MARPKKPEGELKDQRVPIVMSEAELKQLDDWMHENRIRSRGEAIRRLCQMGMVVSESDLLMHPSLRAMTLMYRAMRDNERRGRGEETHDFAASFEAFTAAVMLLVDRTIPAGVKIHELLSGSSLEEAMREATNEKIGYPYLPTEDRKKYEALVEAALDK